MRKNLLSAVFVLFSAIKAFSWTDGELLVWTTDNRGYRALAELGKKFSRGPFTWNDVVGMRFASQVFGPV